MIIYKLPDCRVIEKLPEGCAIALGNFDGVHRGHQKLFELAGEKGHKKAVWTFTTLAKPDAKVPYLTDMKSKTELFKEYGIDYAVFEDFEAIRNRSCADFIEKYLVENFKPARVVCGFNFRFGKGGKGDANALRELLCGFGIDVEILNPVLYNSIAVSSSEIRAAVEAGDMEKASVLLGHSFFVDFPVVEGKRLGRKIGFPTINQNFPTGHIVPSYGVYACVACVDGNRYHAVTNVGVRPTVSEENVSVNCETHIMGYDGSLYGKKVKVEFYKKLRDEMRFENIDALTVRLEKDIERAKEILRSLNA